MFRGHIGGMISTWQTIDSAPKDGTVILVIFTGIDVPVAVKWVGDGWRVEWDHWVLPESEWPSHWMHCPAAPLPQHTLVNSGP